MSKKIVGCNRPDCRVAEGQGCLDDVEFVEECGSIIFASSPVPIAKEEYRSVDPGNGLSLDDIATIHQDRRIPTVSIIGSGESGKTTFLGVLFHRFMRTAEGFNGHLFMDSLSFLALNKKYHYADVKAQSETVQMPRTSFDEEPGYHFQTKNSEGEVCESVWIDLPGEVMLHSLSKGKGGWQDYRSLARSTHVILFLDLAIISDPMKRAAYIAQGLDVLSYSVQSNTWKNKDLLVAFTKADSYLDGLSQPIDKIKEKFDRVMKTDFSSISFVELHSLGAEADREKSFSQVWDWVYA